MTTETQPQTRMPLEEAQRLTLQLIERNKALGAWPTGGAHCQAAVNQNIAEALEVVMEAAELGAAVRAVATWREQRRGSPGKWTVMARLLKNEAVVIFHGNP